MSRSLVNVRIPKGKAPALGQIAEQLLLFESVVLNAHLAGDAVKLIEALMTCVDRTTFERWICDGTIRLMVGDPIACSLAPAGQETAAKDPAVFKIAAQIPMRTNEHLPVLLQLGPDNFLSEFEEATKKFLPSDLRHRLLSSYQTPKVDFDRIVAATVEDMKNRTIFTAAGGTRDKAMATVRLLSANYALSLTMQGLCVSCGSGDHEIVSAKLHSVFRSNPSVITQASFDALLDINDLPRIGQLIDTGHIQFGVVMGMREKYGKPFRDWFQNLTSNPMVTPRTVEKEWLKLLQDHRPQGSTNITRRLTVFAMEQLAGILHPLAGAGLSLVNAIVPSEGSSGNAPYVMFDHIRRYIADK